MTTLNLNDESTLQRECERIVEHEVWCMVTPEVEFILRWSDEGTASTPSPFTWDDVENMYSTLCEVCGEEENHANHVEGECMEYQAAPSEVLEWWKVSNWLLEKLAAKGEPVIRDANIWGRCTSGMAISMDSVIREIVRELHNAG